MSDKQNDPESPPLSGLIGFALLGLCIVGLSAILLAVIAIGRNEYVGAGVLMIAAALSFGLLLNGVVRS